MMQSRYNDRQDLIYELKDVTDVSITEKANLGKDHIGHFDLIIDKGCLDSILCGEYSSKKARK